MEELQVDIPTKTTITRPTYGQQLKEAARWKGSTVEIERAKSYFQGFSNWQVLVIIGIAISGLASFVNTYDAWSKINTQIQAALQTGTIQKELNTQFIVILVLSCLAIALGIVLAWLFRHATNPRRIVTLGIITAGIFGILYAVSMKFQTASTIYKLGASWGAFLAFIILGFVLSSRDAGKIGVKWEPSTKTVKVE